MPKVNRQSTQQAVPAKSRSTTAPPKPAPAAAKETSKGWSTSGTKGSAIDTKAARTAFWHSPYTTADAKAAQKAFKLPSLDAAKEFIGKAVITRSEEPLAAKGITRQRWDDHDCTVAFQRSPYSEADAKAALKKLPFLKNLEQAKQYIGLKIVNKTESILEEVGVTRSPYDQQDMLAAFKRGGYSAADVAQAKKKFDFLKDAKTEDVKAYMGLKVLNDFTSMLADQGITPGRDRHETP